MPPSHHTARFIRGHALAATTLILLVGISPSSRAEPNGQVTAAVARITEQSSLPSTPLERLAALRKLSPPLRSTDAEALLKYLKKPSPSGADLPVWHTFVNDAYDLLLRQKPSVPGLGKQLIHLAGRGTDAVLKDYALQKLGVVAGADAPPETRRLAMQAIVEAALACGPHLQGTALLAWQRANDGTPEPRRGLETAITLCLDSTDASTAAKVAALQAGSAAKLFSIGKYAREILEIPGQNQVLAASALAALSGLGGGEEDRNLISLYLKDPVSGAAAAKALAVLPSSR